MKKCKLLLLALMVCISMQGFAQWTQLTDTLLLGGEIRGIAKTGSAVYKATNGGLFKSTDYGVNWTYVTPNLDTACGKAVGVSATSMFLYVLLQSDMGKIYRSTSEGVSWSPTGNAGLSDHGYIDQIALFSGSHTLFALLRNMSKDTLFYSSNGGDNWSVAKGFNSEIELLPSINTYNRLYIYKNDSVFYTENGTNFILVNFTGLPENKIKARESVFTGEPNGDPIYYAYDSCVYKYNGSSWSKLSYSGLPTLFRRVMGVHATDNALFVEIIYMDFGGLGSKVFRSKDHGASFTEVLDAPGEVVMFTGLNGLIGFDASHLIAHHTFGDSYYSSDTGSTWSKSNNGLCITGGNRMIERADTLYLLKENNGIIRSIDKGNSWHLFNTGLPDFMGVCFVTELFEVGGRIYTIGVKNPMAGDSAYLYRLGLDGQTWMEIAHSPDPTYHFLSYVGKGSTNENAFFMRARNRDFNSSSECNYYRVTNYGTFWESMTSSLSSLSLEEIYGFYGREDAVDTLFLFGQDAEQNEKIYLSTNGGYPGSPDWRDVSISEFSHRIIRNTSSGAPQKIITNFVGENQRAMLMIQNFHKLSYHLNQACMFNAGAWDTLTSTGLPLSRYSFKSSINNNGLWCLASTNGVFVSTNYGTSWNSVANTSFPMGVEAYSLLSLSDTTVYIGTYGNGVWKTKIRFTPSVVTNAVTSITDHAATCGGNIDHSGFSTVGARGVCWNILTNPTISNSHTTDGVDIGTFVSSITSLLSNTGYYVRAYATNNAGTSYGNERFFTTETGVGENEINISYQFTFYPNPTVDQLTLEFDLTKVAPLQVEIMDLNGKKVMSKTYSNVNLGNNVVQLNTSTIPAGIYLMNVKSGQYQSQHKLSIIK